MGQEVESVTKRWGLCSGLSALIVATVPQGGGVASAAPTSCDIVTGASCFYNEGCDCDHDGYVRSNGKAWRYCHFNKCPIDGNDNDASVLGVTSQYNADGDGWTTAYDCNDSDACVINDCSNTCGPPPEDADGDGFGVDVDCDDGNYYVKPGATIACCSCEVLRSPSQSSTFNCSNNPCPSGTVGDDVVSSDTGTPSDTTTPIDTRVPDDGMGGVDTTPIDTAQGGGDTGPLEVGSDPAGYEAPPGDPQFVGGGVLVRGEQPAPGCAGGASGGALALFSLGVLGLRVARRRRASALGLALLVVTTTSACVTVQPWERGRLAKAPMIFGGEGGGEGLEQHMFQYREGAAGGFGGGGGGCGCN